MGTKKSRPNKNPGHSDTGVRPQETKQTGEEQASALEC